MNVSAIIVTRGDVDLLPVLGSLPTEWEVLVWDNGEQCCAKIATDPREYDVIPGSDLSVYGRYAAIEHASHDLIYVQDDDVIVSDPQAIVNQWGNEFYEYPGLVANMPQEFRHSGYTDSCLVGFGACFHRDAPAEALSRFLLHPTANEALFDRSQGDDPRYYTPDRLDPVFHRTCDVIFTTLTPRVLVDVPKTNLPYATDENRMYRQPGHVGERTRMLELARIVRDDAARR